MLVCLMSVTLEPKVNIPANAPHQFHNASSKPVRMLCICSPAGQEEFFKEVGTPVATRTAPPPKVDAAQEADFRARRRASCREAELIRTHMHSVESVAKLFTSPLAE